MCSMSWPVTPTSEEDTVGSLKVCNVMHMQRYSCWLGERSSPACRTNCWLAQLHLQALVPQMPRKMRRSFLQYNATAMCAGSLRGSHPCVMCVILAVSNMRKEALGTNSSTPKSLSTNLLMDPNTPPPAHTSMVTSSMSTPLTCTFSPRKFKQKFAGSLRYHPGH